MPETAKVMFFGLVGSALSAFSRLEVAAVAAPPSWNGTTPFVFRGAPGADGAGLVVKTGLLAGGAILIGTMFGRFRFARSPLKKMVYGPLSVPTTVTLPAPMVGKSSNSCWTAAAEARP